MVQPCVIWVEATSAVNFEATLLGWGKTVGREMSYVIALN